jgi:hypothetical protein
MLPASIIEAKGSIGSPKRGVPRTILHRVLERPACIETDPLLDRTQQFAGGWPAGPIEVLDEKARYHWFEARGILLEQAGLHANHFGPAPAQLASRRVSCGNRFGACR